MPTIPPSVRALPARRRAALVAACAGALGLSGAAGATGVPSQTPLLSSVSNPPSPNVFIDIDDSGSMQAHYMPEGTVYLKTSSSSWARPALPVLNVIYDMIDVFYGDQQLRTYPINGGGGRWLPAGISYAVPGNTDAVSGVFQRWMRSSDINSIFYNPAVLYLPWQHLDATSGSFVPMPPASYTAAYWNIADSTIKNPTVDLSKVGPLATSWCTGNSWTTCDNGTQVYDPGLFYVLKNDGQNPPTYTADPNLVSSYTEYDLNNAAVQSYPGSAARLCTSTVTAGSGCCASIGPQGCTRQQEQQNFANWFQYYRTRTHLVKGGLSQALVNVLGTVRVGWGTINTPPSVIDGVPTSGVVVSGMRNLDTPALDNVLTGLFAINPYGGTPLRLATQSVGEYFRSTGTGSPWANVPGTDGAVASCRRSYHLMTTDGYYNDAAQIGDIDSVNGPDYAGANPLNAPVTRYIAGLPYADGQSDMLADFAMYYYVHDLRPDVPNEVRPDDGSGDVAFWQHLSMFTVGLGVRGTLNPATDLPGLINGTLHWGTDHIDDLWHAALDTHGQFFSVKDSVQLSSALTTALGAAVSSSLHESGATASSGTLTAGTTEYLPVYTTVQWTGDVMSFGLNSTTGQPASTPNWIASHAMPAPASRNIWTWDGVSASLPFDTGMPAGLKARVTPTVPLQDLLINYLRGDPTNESASVFRVRQRDKGATGTLGDFLDSPPTLVQNLVDLGYDNLVGAPGYRSFVTQKNARTYGVLFEGANDGMLHGFRSTDGAEVYAYVPWTQMPALSTLSQQSYGLASNFHRDFVDGPQTETDAFVPTTAHPNAGWANLLVGSYGAGSPGFYVLDTTDLGNLGGATLQAEFSGSTDPDIGYITTRIPVGPISAAPTPTGRLPNGSWQAFVPNGVDSASGNAVLLVVDLTTKAITKVTLDATGSNGLTGVSLVRDASQQVVAAYAGDLKGNLYRIEFTGSNAPIESFGAQPLFRAVSGAGVAQPISVPPTVYANPAGGNVVLFGTGQLIAPADVSGETDQTFYGIYDPTPAGGSSEGKTSPFASAMAAGTQRTLLLQQTISADGTNAAGQPLYAVTPNTLTRQLGWFMDLSPVNTTQRVLYPAQIVSNYVLVNTVGPAQPQSNVCKQVAATSAFFLLPALTGTAPSAPVWDTDGNGVVNASDSSASGYASSGAGQNTVVMVPGAQNPNEFVNVTAGGNTIGAPPPGASHAIVQRVWQQLATPPF